MIRRRRRPRTVMSRYVPAGTAVLPLAASDVTLIAKAAGSGRVCVQARLPSLKHVGSAREHMRLRDLLARFSHASTGGQRPRALVDAAGLCRNRPFGGISTCEWSSASGAAAACRLVFVGSAGGWQALDG